VSIILSISISLDSQITICSRVSEQLSTQAAPPINRQKREYSQRPSIRSLCAASFRPVSRSTGRTIASVFNPGSIVHSIRCGHRKAISDLAMADLPETKSEEADRLRTEAKIRNNLAEMGRIAWEGLQDLSKSEALARSEISWIESQLLSPGSSVSCLQKWLVISSSYKLPSERRKFLREMHSRQKDYLTSFAETRNTLEAKLKRTIAFCQAASPSTVIPFASYFPSGSPPPTSNEDSVTSTISLGGTGSDCTLTSLPVTASDPVTKCSVTGADLVDRASSKSNERQSTLPTSSLPSSSPDWAPEAEG
jgi:hypothetical protein